MNLTLGIFIIILADHPRHHLLGRQAYAYNDDFYAADSQLTASQNGFALAVTGVAQPPSWASPADCALRHGWCFLCAWPAGRLLHGVVFNRGANAHTGKLLSAMSSSAECSTRTSLLATIAGTVVVTLLI